MLGYTQCVIEVPTLHLDDIKSIACILIPLTSERLRFLIEIVALAPRVG